MAWKPKFWGNKPTSAKSEAAALDDDDTDDQLDDVETPDEEEPKDEPAAAAKETPATDAPAAESDSSARIKALEAENEKLRARAGEKTLEQCQLGAMKAAVRLFGQKSPLLTEAKKQVKLCSTPDEADAFRAAWDLAMSTTPLARLAGRTQTTGASAGSAAKDPADLSASERASAAAQRTRGRNTTMKESK